MSFEQWLPAYISAGYELQEPAITDPGIERNAFGLNVARLVNLVTNLQRYRRVMSEGQRPAEDLAHLAEAPLLPLARWASGRGDPRSPGLRRRRVKGSVYAHHRQPANGFGDAVMAKATYLGTECAQSARRAAMPPGPVQQLIGL
jgi:hypothetical protein